MALPTFNMRQLLEAGVHFGHQKHRWNPKMAPYIFGSRNNIHIIDLAQTVPLLHQALVAVSDTVAGGGRILFVGTKRQASDAIAEAARRSAQYFINHRWFGGSLTNWQTISHSIRRLRYLEELFEGEAKGLLKKELLRLTRERDKLERALGGIKDMGGLPDLLFIIDTNKESIAVAEARKLGIPVIAVVDSNCDPASVTHPIPGNDDAGRAITLYCDLIARAAIDGIERGQGGAGLDAGAGEEPPAEPAIQEAGEDRFAAQSREEMPVAGAAEEAAAPAAGAEAMQTAETAAEATPAPAAEPSGAPAADVQPAEARPDEAQPDAAPETGGFKGLDKPEGEPDDLKKITGVGPVLEQKLNDYGIYHYRQIAGLNQAEIAEIDAALDLKGRLERDDWLTQAQTLMKEKV